MNDVIENAYKLIAVIEEALDYADEQRDLKYNGLRAPEPTIQYKKCRAAIKEMKKSIEEVA